MNTLLQWNQIEICEFNKTDLQIKTHRYVDSPTSMSYSTNVEKSSSLRTGLFSLTSTGSIESFEAWESFPALPGEMVGTVISGTSSSSPSWPIVGAVILGVGADSSWTIDFDLPSEPNVVVTKAS